MAALELELSLVAPIHISIAPRSVAGAGTNVTITSTRAPDREAGLESVVNETEEASEPSQTRLNLNSIRVKTALSLVLPVLSRAV